MESALQNKALFCAYIYHNETATNRFNRRGH